MPRIQNRKLLYIILSFVLLSFLSVLVFFIKFKFNILLGTTDMPFHLRRIVELKESITHGNLFPKFSLNLNHGSVVMSMYPYLSVYPFALLLIINHSLIIDYYIFIILTTFVTCIISFFSSLRYSKSVMVSYIFSVVYSLSSSFIFISFYTGDLGITTAMSVIPLSVFGIIDLYNGYNNCLKLAIGLVLLLFCQLPAFIVTIIFLILWNLIYIKEISKDIIRNLFEATLLTILLSSIVWIPLIYTVFTNNIFSVSTSKILTGAANKNLINNLGFISPIALIIIIFYFNQFNKINKKMYLLALFMIFISSKYMPWKLVSYLPIIHLVNQLQFAQRFLIIPQVLLCYLFSVSLLLILKNHNMINKKIFISICILFIILLQLSSQIMVIDNKLRYFPQEFTNYNIIKNNNNESLGNYFIKNNKSIHYILYGYFNNYDYYPKLAVKYKKLMFNNNGISNSKSLVKLHRLRYNKFIFNIKHHYKYIVLPFVYYKHEHVHVIVNGSLCHFNMKRDLITIYGIKNRRNVLNIQYLSNVKIDFYEGLAESLGLLWVIYRAFVVERKYYN